MNSPQAHKPGTAPADAAALLRSGSYVVFLLLGAVIGVPVAAVSYFFLKAVDVAQRFVFSTLPGDLGYATAPAWWPVVPLFVSGVVVALSIRYLPGTSGHKPTAGFKSSGAIAPVDLYGIVIASLATLCLGVVLGPEAPLIAIGGGLGALAMQLIKRDAPAAARAVVGTAGSFAAIASLLGSPITGAFLLMEAAGLGGPALGVILVPGLLAAGIGSLIFVGLDSWTGYGTFSLTIAHIPSFTSPDGSEFLWAIVIGAAAALVGTGIHVLAVFLQPRIEARMLLLTPVAGLAVAGCAIAFDEATGRGSSPVLFSGQTGLAILVQNAAGWTAGALVLLVLFKSLAYGISMSCFRGGPVFPAIFLGAAGGMAFAHLPGLPMIAGVGMGIGAMSVAMLKLPLTSVLLASLLLLNDAPALMPLVIVAVVVSYVISARLAPPAPAAKT